MAVFTDPRRTGVQATAPYVGLVASRGGCPSNFLSADKQLMARSKHVAMDDMSAFQLVYANFYVALPSPYEATPGGAATFTASIEYPVGTLTVVKFGGAVSGVAADGAVIISDPVPLFIPRGAAFYVRTWQANAAGILNNGEAGLNNVASAVPNSGEWMTRGVTTADLTQSTTNANNLATGRHYRPAAIIGYTTRRTFFLAGDSRMGQGVVYDASPNSYGGRGEVERSLVKSFATFNAGCSGEKLSEVIAGNYSKRMQFAQYCSHVVCEYGFNDLASGTSLATMQANLGTFAGMFGGKPFYQTTIPPGTTSSDSWTTSGGQTVNASNAVRISFNNALRNGVAAPVTGHIEVADQVETFRDSGIWKTVGRNVTDAAITTGTANLTSASAAFNSQDVGRTVSVAGAGAAGAALTATINSVTNATTVVLSANAGTTVSGATANIGTFGYTGDGVHANSNGFALTEASTAFSHILAS